MFPSNLTTSRSRGDFILIEHDLYCTLELCNPKARNAVSINMMRQLEPIVERLEAIKPLCLIIFGAENFCSGGDLNDVRQHLMNSSEAMLVYMTDLLNRIQLLPTFVIAAVDGSAVGGGAELVTVADYIICHEAAQIGFVHARLGVSPGWGGLERLIRKVGAGVAMSLLCSARKVAAGELLHMRLINEIVSEYSAYEHACKLTKTIVGNHTDAVRGIIEVSKLGYSEKDLFSKLWGSNTHRKALGLDES